MTSFSVPPLTWSDTSLATLSASQTNTGDSKFSSFFQSASSDPTESTDDKSAQTEPATRTDRSRPDDKRDDKRQHAAPANDNAATLLGSSLPSQLIVDDRKLQLSLDRTAAGNAAHSATGAAATDAAKVAQNKPNNGAPSKGGVAFGANLHMNANQVSDSSTNKGTQAIADSKNSGRKDHDEADKDDQVPAKNVVAASSTNAPASSSTHAAPALSSVASQAAPEQVQAAYAANAASKPIEAAPVMSAAPLPDALPTARDSKTIDFQVGSADDNAVNVRVSQRAGDVQVTVRTPDSELAQSLRQHLPELSDRLSQSGVQGDLWQPSTASATNDQSSDSSSADGSHAGQEAFSDAQSNQKQQEKNQSAWLNQMYEAEPNR